MDHSSLIVRPGRSWPLVDGVVLLGGFMLAFAAFDDITTDASGTTFVPEYSCLIVVAAAWTVIGLRLIKKGRRLLGWSTLALLAAAIWAQRGIGPGTRPNIGVEYLTITFAGIWFLALSCGLITFGIRNNRAEHTAR